MGCSELRGWGGRSGEQAQTYGDAHLTGPEREGRFRMRVYVRLYGPMRVVVGSDEIALTLAGASATVAQALEAVVTLHPRAARYLGGRAGELAPGVRLLLGAARLDEATALATPLRDGDRLTLLQPVAGG